MIDITPLNVPSILKQYSLHPKKSLGQNFLSQADILNHIVAKAEVSENDTVLEVGPGVGSLTRYLAEAAKNVIAVELDYDFIPILSHVLQDYDNVKVIQGDILKCNMAELLPSGNYLVVANIPYLITSALIRHLLEAENKPSRVLLTIQKEVAERICAPQGKLSMLALSVQVYGAPKQVLKIPAAAFYPSPKVDSAALRIDLYPEPVIPKELLDTFFKLMKAGFSQKRKMLKNSMANGLHVPVEEISVILQQAGIDDRRRAETLSLIEWRSITERYAGIA